MFLISQFNPAPQSKLITRYIYNGNKEIQPSSVDLTTGIFTTATPHGIPAGTIKNVIIVPNFIFNGQFPREFISADQHRIEAIDANTFYIWKGTTARMTYTNAMNTGVNVLSFRFETDTLQSGVTFDISAIPTNKIRFLYKGNRGRPGWTYVYLKYSYGPLNTIEETNFGTFSDGRDMNMLYFEGFIENDNVNDANFLVGHVDKYINNTWNEGNGTWAMNHTTNNNGAPILQRQKNIKLQTLRFSFEIANGSIIEIYNARD